MNTVENKWGNHYEIVHIDKNKDWNPHLIIDTKNPIFVGETIELYNPDKNEKRCYVVKSLTHRLVHVDNKGDGQFYNQEGNWNTFLYVDEI